MKRCCCLEIGSDDPLIHLAKVYREPNTAVLFRFNDDRMNSRSQFGHLADHPGSSKFRNPVLRRDNNVTETGGVPRMATGEAPSTKWTWRPTHWTVHKKCLEIEGVQRSVICREINPLLVAAPTLRCEKMLCWFELTPLGGLQTLAQWSSLLQLLHSFPCAGQV